MQKPQMENESKFEMKNSRKQTNFKQETLLVSFISTNKPSYTHVHTHTPKSNTQNNRITIGRKYTTTGVN